MSAQLNPAEITITPWTAGACALPVMHMTNRCPSKDMQCNRSHCAHEAIFTADCGRVVSNYSITMVF